MTMGDKPLRYESPRLFMKLERNHFDSKGPETPCKPFEYNTVCTTINPIKRLTAALKASERTTGVYRFAHVNALRRKDRTYKTFDDPEMIEKDEST